MGVESLRWTLMQTAPAETSKSAPTATEPLDTMSTEGIWDSQGGFVPAWQGRAIISQITRPRTIPIVR